MCGSLQRPGLAFDSRRSTLRASDRQEQGQTMAEYAVILAVITAGILAALLLLSGAILAVIQRVAGVIG
jgi:Flp pilus assembly pilin Flp